MRACAPPMRARGFACVRTQARAEARRCREPAGGAATGATRHAASNASGGGPRARQAGVPLSSSQWRRRTAAQRPETSVTARPQAPCRCRARLRGRRGGGQGAAQRERIRSPEPLPTHHWQAPRASAAPSRQPRGTRSYSGTSCAARTAASPATPGARCRSLTHELCCCSSASARAGGARPLGSRRWRRRWCSSRPNGAAARTA
jgi:hypothetical protein